MADNPYAAQLPTEDKIHVDGGKYTVVLRSNGTSTALRYGEEWPAFAGTNQLDNLTTALARDLQETREKLSNLIEAIRPLKVNQTPITQLDTRLRASFAAGEVNLLEGKYA